MPSGSPLEWGSPGAPGRQGGRPRGGGRWGPEVQRGSAPARMTPFSTLGSKAKPQHPSGFEQRLSADSAFTRVPCCGPGKTQSPGRGPSRRHDLQRQRQWASGEAERALLEFCLLFSGCQADPGKCQAGTQETQVQAPAPFTRRVAPANCIRSLTLVFPTRVSITPEV